jgi:small subunit ribosomal protein S8
MTNDNIADMLTRLRNASLAKHSFSLIIYSKVNLAILKVLLSEGYILNYHVEEIDGRTTVLTTEAKQEKKTNQKIIKVFLKYKGWWIKKSFFSILQRISKPGKRVFSSYKNLNDVVNVLAYQQGIAILSTSSGVMSHLKATQLKKGGEILCYVS